MSPDYAPFELDGKATLKHVNLRKEGNEEDRVAASDLKLVVLTNADILLAFDPALKGFLFKPDGAVRFPVMGPVEWDSEIRSIELTLKPPGREPCIYRDVKLKNFLITPGPSYSLDLTMSAQLHTQDGDASVFHRLLMEEISIEVRRASDLFDNDAKKP